MSIHENIAKEHSKLSSRFLSSFEDKSDHVAFEIEKKLSILSKLKTESDNLQQIIDAPSLKQRIKTLEESIEEIEFKWYTLYSYLEDQYTKVLQNMETRTHASNGDYKIKVDVLQRQEQDILQKISTGNEVLIEATSTQEEGVHKVKYMRSNLASMRSSRKEAISKHLQIAKNTAKNLIMSCKISENPNNGLNEEERKSLDWHKDILRKLQKVSITTELRKKEIDENLQNLMNLFKTLGMPDLSECVSEYERVVITNNSLSKKSDVLLGEIQALQKNLKDLNQKELEYTKKSSEKPKIMITDRETYSKDTTLAVYIYELFKDLNMKIDKEMPTERRSLVKVDSFEDFEKANGKDVKNTWILIKALMNKITVMEDRVMERITQRGYEDWADGIETRNSHAYIKNKEPRSNYSYDASKEFMYTDNKQRYIIDMLESALQVENKAKQIVKAKQNKVPREQTPLVAIEVPTKDESFSNFNKVSTEYSAKCKDSFKVSSVFEKRFDKNMRKVSSQTLKFRKNKSNDWKSAKFYCQEMLSKKDTSRTIGKSPRNIATSPMQGTSRTAEEKISIKSQFPVLSSQTPISFSSRTLATPRIVPKHSYTTENLNKLRAIYRL